jgi:hypothetical protein
VPEETSQNTLNHSRNRRQEDALAHRALGLAVVAQVLDVPAPPYQSVG